jgi:hypothetical protein
VTDAFFFYQNNLNSWLSPQIYNSLICLCFFVSELSDFTCIYGKREGYYCNFRKDTYVIFLSFSVVSVNEWQLFADIYEENPLIPSRSLSQTPVPFSGKMLFSTIPNGAEGTV